MNELFSVTAIVKDWLELYTALPDSHLLTDFKNKGDSKRAPSINTFLLFWTGGKRGK